LQQGDPIEERYKEYSDRGEVIDELINCINSYREAALSNVPKFDHIDISEKQKVTGIQFTLLIHFWLTCNLKVFSI